MAIPGYQTMMLPFLKFASDGKEHSKQEMFEYLVKIFNVSDEEKKKLLPSGRQEIFNNRVGWARTYLKKAGLTEYTKRGYFKITSRGMDVLKEDLADINVSYLKKFPEFVEFIKPAKKEESVIDTDDRIVTTQTPEEVMESVHLELQKDLSQELLNRIKECSPDFFEKLVVELLVKMGYGGSRKDAGEAIGRSGDEGIDGIIKEDKLGLDVVYIQAKRWAGTVGSKEIRNFVGSLVGQKANKGIFITTSTFTKEALSYVTTIQHKVILIDGERLAQFMIDNDLGVSRVASFEIKKIDLDYFEED